MASTDFKEGDEVSWNWGTSHPSGTVAEVKTEGKLEIESKGKLVHKNASPSNPAVHVERQGNDVVKRASELNKEGSTNGNDDKNSSTSAQPEDKGHADNGTADDSDKHQEKEPSPKTDAMPDTGDKRKRAEEDGDSTFTGDPEKGKKKKTRKASGKGAQTKEADEPKKRGRNTKKATGNKKTSEDEEMRSHADTEKESGCAKKAEEKDTQDEADAPENPPDGVPAAGTRSRDT